MDKEIRDKHYRVVGTLEALEKTATHAVCMTNDATTFALLDAIRGLANKAVLSAWNYAETQTAEGKTASEVTK